MWILWIVLAAVILYFVMERNKSTGGSPPAPRGQSPLDILKRRYASGEISREEFESMKKDLES